MVRKKDIVLRSLLIAFIGVSYSQVMHGAERDKSFDADEAVSTGKVIRTSKDKLQRHLDSMKNDLKENKDKQHTEKELLLLKSDLQAGNEIAIKLAKILERLDLCPETIKYDDLKGKKYLGARHVAPPKWPLLKYDCGQLSCPSCDCLKGLDGTSCGQMCLGEEEANKLFSVIYNFLNCLCCPIWDCKDLRFLTKVSWEESTYDLLFMKIVESMRQYKTLINVAELTLKKHENEANFAQKNQGVLDYAQDIQGTPMKEETVENVPAYGWSEK